MFNADKVKSFVRHAAVVIAVAATGTGIAAAPAAAKLAGAGQSVSAPQSVPGCQTDEGYGRFSSCDNN